MDGNGFPLVDTHAHIFHPRLRATNDARYVPDYEARLDQYLNVLAINGMGRGVLVQPSFLGSDNSYLLAGLAVAPDTLRGVIVVATDDLRRELSLERVRDLHESGVRGVRLNLVGRPVPDLLSAVWKAAGSVMAAEGWHLEIQASGQQWLDLAPALAEWPTKLVIDHLGLPQSGHPETAEAVLDLAGRNKTWVKVSAPYRSSYDQAAVMFSRLLEQGSPDRLVFGSDWPFTRHEENTYQELLVWAQNLAGEEQLNRMMTINPHTLLEWPEPSRNTTIASALESSVGTGRDVFSDVD
ncbi:MULTISPECIES: amidohydrolase family protein [Micrococcaceae]|uniref:amidohydrolase family protein n=1 Tax=Micrococcaceae TaxID=1268 RepID=UPI0006FB6D0E|nr:amidohydrolase family protein [Arthrobacter sp. Soil761]KRE77139.1 hypothetical protein ASG79_17265 [Arthrobacter sp. Soil761]